MFSLVYGCKSRWSGLSYILCGHHWFSWEVHLVINTHLCWRWGRRSAIKRHCVNYEVFPMSTFPSVLHSLLHLNFLTRLKQIRSHMGSLHASRKLHAIWSEPNLCVCVCMCVREWWGCVVIYRMREASLSLLISLMQQGATAPAVTAGPKCKSTSHLTSTSCLVSLTWALFAFCHLPRSCSSSMILLY